MNSLGAPLPQNPVVLKRYGNFILLDRIGLGGMAEIFRARPATAEANGRILVLKRMLPEIIDDPSFLRMFKAEIRISMAFNHPNTLQIHEFGTAEDRPFLAMEYVRGRNLKAVAAGYYAIGELMPMPMAIHIVLKAACGLHYAHTFENKATGEKLNLVHRDVSPQNLLVSTEGGVKVIDFGVAKASLRGSDPTRPGTIKGKISYLSPEQVTGDSVDARSDVFSLGIVLWELLTGRSLFAGNGQETQHSIMKSIGNFEQLTPPSAINPVVPAELDDIVLTALQRRPERRFPSADAFAQALQAFLWKQCPQYGREQVVGEMVRLLGDEISADDHQLKALNQKSQRLLLNVHGAARAVGAKTLLVRPEDARVPPSSVSFTPIPPQRPLRPSRWRTVQALLPVLILAGWVLDSRFLIHQRLLLPQKRVIMAAYGPPLGPNSPEPPPEILRRTSGELATPTVQAARIVSVRFHLPPLGGAKGKNAHAPEIRVNSKRVDPKRMIVRVQLDRPFLVEVRSSDTMPFKKLYVLDSIEHGEAKSVNLTLPLTPKKAKGRR